MIAWQSNNINVLSNTGKVTRPKAIEGDSIITLTAILSKGEVKDTKNFFVTVKAKDFTDEELVDISLKDLSLEGNLNCIIDNIKLPTRDEKNKTDIEWKSSNNAIVSNTGVVTRTNKDENVTLTAIVKRGYVTKNKEFKIIVKAKEVKTEEALKLISDSLKIDNVNNIEKDIKLQTSLDGANIVWKSSNEAVIDNTGKIKRPQMGQPNANVTLTATITKDGKSITKDFNLTVKALTELVANNKEEFYNIIKDALEAFETKVSIKIPNYSDNDYNSDILNQILIENPYIDYGYEETEWKASGYKGFSEKTLSLNIKYKMDKATMEMEKRAVKAKVQEIIKNVVKEGMTDVQKELALHDYIVKNAEYNIDNYSKGIITAEDHNAYGILVKNIGVCESYAKAMYELLNAAGVECKYVTGFSKSNGAKGGGHAWNIVKLDGEWYNLDATWDDPVSDRNGAESVNKNTNPMVTVNHTYFNIPDSIFNNDHMREPFEEKKYPKCTANQYSYNNMDVDEYTADGKLIKKVKSKEELDKEILQALLNKESALSLRIKGFKMTKEQLKGEFGKVATENKIWFSSWGTSAPDDYHVNYTIKWS